MAKYHLTDNGPAPCRVVTGTCPFGGEHFNTKGEARVAYEAEMADRHPLEGRKPRREIREADELLDFEKTEGLSPEAFDEMFEEFSSKRQVAVDLYSSLESKDFRPTAEELSKLERELENASEKVAELLEIHESEALNLKKVHQIISTLNDEAKVSIDFDYDEMLPLYEKTRTREEYKNLLREAMDLAKDNHAMLIAARAEAEIQAMKDDGEYLTFDGEELYDADGNLVGTKTAYFPSGSVEWLEERSKGLGGSDIPYLLGASNVARKPAILKDGEWVYLDDVKRYPGGNAHDLMEKKLFPGDIQADHRYRDGAEKFTDATGRGDAWESELLLQQMKKYPGEVAYCKSSFASVENPELRYNFDGLMVDKTTGRPNGVIEIKTASHVDHWGNPADGLDGVPDNYRAQTLHYALEAGFDQGRVAVVINDADVREYSFSFKDNPELREEALSNRAKALEFSGKLKELKATSPESYARPTRAVRAFTATQLNPKDLSSKKRIFETAAIYRGTTPSKVKEEYLKARADGLDTPEKQAEALRSLFTNVGESDRRPEHIVGIDLETSGLSPDRGRVIDLGIEEVQGDVTRKTADDLYGVSEYGKRHERGVGYEDLRAVHNITSSMVADKEPFKPTPELVKTLTQPGTVIMAHNATFEQRWLSSYVPGFNNALRRGTISVIDTKDLSQWLDDTPGNTMNHYGHKWGVYSSIDGEEEHRAYADAKDMVQAYRAQRSALRGEGN